MSWNSCPQTLSRAACDQRAVRIRSLYQDFHTRTLLIQRSGTTPASIRLRNEGNVRSNELECDVQKRHIQSLAVLRLATSGYFSFSAFRTGLEVWPAGSWPFRQMLSIFFDLHFVVGTAFMLSQMVYRHQNMAEEWIDCVAGS